MSGTGPVRALCEVIASRRIGSYHALTVEAPEIAARTEPGQFVSIAVEGDGMLLRRPFSVCAVRDVAGTVDIAFEANGRGTVWLAGRARHDVLDIVGSLGRPFSLPRQPVGCLLVGGGYGAAPLLFLASRLRRRELWVGMILGAATRRRLFNAVTARRFSHATYLVTEDGSAGTKGRVTDVMDRVLDARAIGVVYACGPMPMLAAVSKIATERGIPVQVAVEEAMACGVGVCWTCVVPYLSGGEVRNIRACVEGPCLNGSQVLWDRIGLAS